MLFLWGRKLCFLASLLADNSKILVPNIASIYNFVLDLTDVIGLVHFANGAQWTSPITSQPHSLNGLSARRVRTKRRYDLCPVLQYFIYIPLLNKLCGRRPQYASAPMTFDHLTLKVVSESRVTWATSVPILVFLGLSVLDLGPMYATNVVRQTSDRRQTASSHNYLRMTRYYHTPPHVLSCKKIGRIKSNRTKVLYGDPPEKKDPFASCISKVIQGHRNRHGAIGCLLVIHRNPGPISYRSSYFRVCWIRGSDEKIAIFDQSGLFMILSRKPLDLERRNLAG